LASGLLSDPRKQPYIHDIAVSIFYRRKEYKFLIFFKRHKLLPINQSIRQLANVDFEGDLVVVAMGNKVGVRNLRGGDEGRAATHAVQR
jgi:hypothetical protein